MNETRLRPSDALRAPIDALRPGDLSAPRGDGAGAACGDESGTITGASESASKGTAGLGRRLLLRGKNRAAERRRHLGAPRRRRGGRLLLRGDRLAHRRRHLGRATATSSKLAGLAIGIGDASGPRAAARGDGDGSPLIGSRALADRVAQVRVEPAARRARGVRRVALPWLAVFSFGVAGFGDLPFFAADLGVAFLADAASTTAATAAAAASKRKVRPQIEMMSLSLSGFGCSIGAPLSIVPPGLVLLMLRRYTVLALGDLERRLHLRDLGELHHHVAELGVAACGGRWRVSATAGGGARARARLVVVCLSALHVGVRAAGAAGERASDLPADRGLTAVHRHRGPFAAVALDQGERAEHFCVGRLSLKIESESASSLRSRGRPGPTPWYIAQTRRDA